MEKKINQILKNQQNIMSALAKLIKEEKKTILMEALNETYWETIHLLNDVKQDKRENTKFYCTICEEWNCDCSSSDCFKKKCQVPDKNETMSDMCKCGHSRWEHTEKDKPTRCMYGNGLSCYCLEFQDHLKSEPQVYIEKAERLTTEGIKKVLQEDNVEEEIKKELHKGFMLSDEQFDKEVKFAKSQEGEE